jgi:hypothetical protein
MACGYDAVVEDVVDIGLGGEAAHGFVIGFKRGRSDGGDAQMLAAPDKAGSGDVDAGFGISRNGGVAVDDDVVVGKDVCLRGKDGGDGQ